MKNSYYANSEHTFATDYRRYYNDGILKKMITEAKDVEEAKAIAEAEEKDIDCKFNESIFSLLSKHFDPKNKSVILTDKNVFFLMRRCFIECGYKTVMESKKLNKAMFDLYWFSTVAFFEGLINCNSKLGHLENLNSIDAPYELATDIAISYFSSASFFKNATEEETFSYVKQKLKWTLDSAIEHAENIISILNRTDREALKVRNKLKKYEDEKERIPTYYHTSVDGPAYNDDSDTTLGETIASPNDEANEIICTSFIDEKATEFFKHLSAADIILCTIIDNSRLPNRYKKLLKDAKAGRSDAEFFKYMLKLSNYISDENIELLAKTVDLSSLNDLENWSNNTFSNHVDKISSDENYKWFRSDRMIYTSPKKRKNK